MHLLLRRLPKLFHLCTDNSINVAQIAIYCGSLKTLSIKHRALRPCEISAILRNDKLKCLQARLDGKAPAQSMDTLPKRLLQLQELRFVYDNPRSEEGPTGLHMIGSLLQKLPSLRTFGLTVKGTDDELPRVIQAASRHLTELGILVVYDRGAAYHFDHRVLQRFKQLEIFECHPETMLGIESCKHKERGDTRHPKHLVSENLPNSLKELWLHVSKDNVCRNGDEQYIHIMRALIDNPSWLPALKLLVLLPGPEVEPCPICTAWYGTGTTNANQEMRAYITEHEYDRLCRLARIRSIDVKSRVDCLPDIPVDNRAKGLNMRRIEKINARRSWYDADRDEDMGLFELFNT